MSSWGGAVLAWAEHDVDRAAEDGAPVYHMWASEMTEHCGIGTWQQNSRVIHAVSPAPGGPYTRRDVTWEAP